MLQREDDSAGEGAGGTKDSQARCGQNSRRVMADRLFGFSRYKDLVHRLAEQKRVEPHRVKTLRVKRCQTVNDAVGAVRWVGEDQHVIVERRRVSRVIADDDHPMSAPIDPFDKSWNAAGEIGPEHVERSVFTPGDLELVRFE